MMDDLDGKITKELEETIYCIRDNDSEDEKKKVLNSFFDEIVKRRRSDVFSGGLQAGLVIGNDACAAKVNENDGYGSHMGTSVNLVRYLNDEGVYITEEGIGYPALYREDLKQLNTEDYIGSQILDGNSKLMMSFISNYEKLTPFQIKTIRSIVDIFKELKDSGIYDDINVGIKIGKSEVEFDKWDENRYDLLRDTIEKEEERIDNNVKI